MSLKLSPVVRSSGNSVTGKVVFVSQCINCLKVEAFTMKYWVLTGAGWVCD